MCESVEKYGDKRAEEAVEWATQKTAIDIFIGMIKEGIPKETAQKIAKLSDDLVEKALKKLAKTM